MKYSIDTSALIQGWVRNYPPDVFPSLWKQIEELILEDVLKASDEVREELSKKEDEVYKWAKSLQNFFYPLEKEIQLAARDILSQFPRMAAARRNRSKADPFVIALAQTKKATVITEEKLTGNPTNPKIPDVCNQLNIPFISLLDFIRMEGWIFPDIIVKS